MLTLDPDSLTIVGVGSTGSFTVSDQKAYSGYFTATTEDKTIATVKPGGAYNEFIVTSTGGGATYIDVASKDGGFARESVSVDNSGTIVNVKGNR